MTDHCAIGEALVARFSEHDHGQGPLLVEIEQAKCSGPYKPLIVCEREAKATFPHGAGKLSKKHSPDWEPLPAGFDFAKTKTVLPSGEYLPLTGPDSILSRLTVGEPCERCEGLGGVRVGQTGWMPCSTCHGTGWTVSICEGHRALVEPLERGAKPPPYKPTNSEMCWLRSPDHSLGIAGYCRYGFGHPGDHTWGDEPPRLSLTELLRVECPCCDDDELGGAVRRSCLVCNGSGTIPHPALQAALDAAREFGLMEEVRA